MRTTLTIDDDVLAYARIKAEASGEPIGTVISRLARQSLTLNEDSPIYDHGIRLLRISPNGRSATLEETLAIRDANQ